MSNAKERLAAKRAARQTRLADDVPVVEQEEVVTESAASVVDPRVASTAESRDMTDTNSMLWFVFGIFFPIIALIVWIFNHKISPRSCARAVKGAIVGICITIVLFFLGMMFATSLMAMLPTYAPSELTPVSVSQESVYTYDETDDDEEDVASSSSKASSAYPGLSKKSSSSARDTAVDDTVDESEDGVNDTEEQTSSRYGLKHNQA